MIIILKQTELSMSEKIFLTSQMSFYGRNMASRKLKQNFQEFNQKIPVVALKHQYD